MSLYGALFSGVSGLTAQSEALGAISDNITNVDTVGYKRTEERFSTLVTEPMTASTYTPGGVSASPLNLVTQQGLLQSSASPTDLSITGNGLFVVNSVINPTATDGQYMFTRAGSFTADANGNLRNAAGLYLQGWKINSNGAIPVNRSDLTALSTVNINGLTGTATPTTAVSMKANLQASQTPGVNGPQVITNNALGINATTDVTGVTKLANNNTFTITNGAITHTFTYKSAAPNTANGEFNTLQDLVNAINGTVGLTATLSSGANPTISVAGKNPTAPITVAGTLNGAGGTPLFATTTGGATYAVGDLANGTVTPQFERSLGIFDSQGGTRQLTLAFVKDGTSPNQWRGEVFIQPPTDTDPIANPNGLVASGIISFNADGTLNAAGTTIPSTLNITWNSSLGISPSKITLGLGTDGQADGFTQFDTPSQQISSSVNGTIFGSFTGVTVSNAGIVTAQFSNGQTRNLYQLPLAIFPNADGLSNQTGNAYGLTPEAGQVSLQQPTTGSAGSISPGTLEASTVDLATEFTNMIITQRAYSAAGKIITTTDQMLNELIQLKQ
ncbi:MAG TPA: flagellar hook-basal body complex protein [Candidatus Cybelea sp.]|nr:flagellar hook-basal body complex protein [Candidatus Cybelea sp.]